MNNASTVSRSRSLIGLVAGAFLVLSSAAHSLLGWKELSAELAKVQATPDLIHNLGIGWHFGGAAMLTFGSIALWTFWQTWQGHAVSLAPTGLIALLYVAFGVWALASSGNPFFLIFIIPGLMMGFASLPQRAA